MAFDAAGPKIEVIDEDRICTAEEHGFRDDFAPLAEHVYRLRLCGEPGANKAPCFQ